MLQVEVVPTRMDVDESLESLLMPAFPDIALDLLAHCVEAIGRLLLVPATTAVIMPARLSLDHPRHFLGRLQLGANGPVMAVHLGQMRLSSDLVGPQAHGVGLDCSDSRGLQVHRFLGVTDISCDESSRFVRGILWRNGRDNGAQ